MIALQLLFLPSRPTCFNLFSRSFYLPPQYYHPPISNRSSLYHISLFNSLPTSSLGAKRCPPGRLPHPSPASLRRLTLRPTSCACVCLHLPRLPIPPLPPLACAQVPVIPWRFLTLWVPPSTLCLSLSLYVLCSKSWHLLVLGFSKRS